jgi:DNA (cytosine-5)-methyltransferase 1
LDAISDLQQENEPYHEFDGLYGHLLTHVPEGLNYSFFTREMGYPKPFFAWRSKFHDFLYKVDRNYPSRTLKAQPGKFTGPFHWKNRYFTVPELKRLQSFPDNYEVVGSFGKVVEQIGNSVPPRLAAVIAVSVREQLLRPSNRLTYPIRPQHFQSTFRQRQRERTRHFKNIAKNEIARRFPNVQLLDVTSVNQQDKFFVGYEGFFTKHTQSELPDIGLGKKYYAVFEHRVSNEITLDIKPLEGVNSKTITIEISGLSKYLLTIDRLACKSRINDLGDVFSVWDIIEDSLTKDSQFFTLIDIYGHYANRGDTVRISTSFNGRSKSTIERALEFFGKSQNCGQLISDSAFSRATSIPEAEVYNIVLRLRQMRWDVRLPETHPTIRGDGILCTYPFPLLSGKAQLERKISGREHP